MPTLPVVEAFARNWWLLLIRGIIAVLFGLMAFIWPGLTLVTLILLYAAYALVDGLMAIWVSVTSRTWGLLLFGSGAGLALAYIITQYMMHDYDNPALWFAFIAMGGGCGLIASYRVEKKELLDRQ